MIKNDPQRKTLHRLYLITGGVWLILLILLLVDNVTAPNTQRNSWGPLALYAIAFLLIVLSMGFVLTLLRRVDRRRALARAGDVQFLDPHQPVSDANALPAGTTIEMRLSKRYYATLFGLIAVVDVVILPLIVGITASTSRPSVSKGDFLLTLVLLLIGLMIVIAIIWLIAFFILRSRMQYNVTVDEEGIASMHNGKTARINWADAQLFAVVDNKRAHRIKVYEVSNAETIVRWLTIPPHVTPFQAMWKPAHISYEEYARKEQGLLSVVAAKTGLKLYDLGESVAKWYM